MDHIDLSGITPGASHLVGMCCVRFGKIAFVGWKGVAWVRRPNTADWAPVKVHRARVMEKMQAGSVAALVRLADAVGIIATKA